MKTESKLKFYEIDVHLQCVCKGDLLVPLVSFCSEEIKNNIEERYYALVDDELRILPNLDLIHKKIEEYLQDYEIPRKLLFILNREEDEYAYVTEVFTGIEMKVDKGLLKVCKLHWLIARSHFYKYTDDEIKKIQYIMENVHEQTKTDSCTIIDLESRRKRRS